MIFQALGGWYRPADVARHVFTVGRAADQEALRTKLAARYGGEATLYHKGRAALAEAVRLATGGSGAVAVSGLTCYSLVQAVEAAGCTPVYVDVREEDLHFSSTELAAAVAAHPEVKAVIIQNMLGIPADIASIEAESRTHGLVVIEDLAHSAGATYADGREVGTVGQYTVLSFGRDKALDVVNGGALIVRGGNEKAPTPAGKVSCIDQLRDRLYPLIAAQARMFYPIGKYAMAAAIRMRLVVRSADGEVDVTRGMPAWQARLGVRQLTRLDATVQHRQDVARQYAVALQLPGVAMATNAGTSPIRYPLLVENRDVMVQRLFQAGVQANDIWYDTPVSPHRYFARVNYPASECPVAVRVAEQLINLPTHVRISSRAVEVIATCLNKEATA